MTGTVAIMQPTYLPWLGYFALMDTVDVFVLLDDVQFSKQSWQQRNRIKTANGPTWLTVSVLRKGRSHQRISEVLIDNTKNSLETHIRTIRQNYKKAPYFEEVFPDLKRLLDRDWQQLCELNIAVIEWIKAGLGIRTQCVRAHELKANGVKAERLVNLCRALGATHYISPLGSSAYLEETDVFRNAGICLTYHEYDHPTYPQLYGCFEENLSTIDLMLNVGKKSLSIIRRGVGKELERMDELK